MLKPRFAACMVSVAIMVLGASGLSGQTYPNKPIRIVAAGLGSGVDFVARIVAPEISEPLGQPVIVQNPGGILSGEVVAKGSPDGYTLLVAGQSHWITPLLRKSSYDPIANFAPISWLTNLPQVLVVHPSVPVKSVKELIAYAKAKPGESLNYSMGSPGGSGFIAMELFKSLSGVDMLGVTYKADAVEIADLIGGRVHLTISTQPKVRPHIESGKLRALAVTSLKPSALAPGLPTIAASGLPGYETLSVIGMFAPAKTPAAIIQRLNQESVRGLRKPEVKEKLFNAGVEGIGSSPEELAATLKSEQARASKLFKDAGVRLE